MALVNEDVPLELLQEIHAEMLKRVELKASSQGKKRARVELLHHVQRLSAALPAGDAFACEGGDHPCDDGTCPPCFAKTTSGYQKFLTVLRNSNAA